MKTLSQFMPLEGMRDRAAEFGRYLWSRWDVPRGSETTRDLDDQRGILPVTEDGRSKISQILPHEAMDMSVCSPVLVVMAALLPVLALLTAVPASFDPGLMRSTAFLVLAVPAVIGAIAITWLMRQCRELMTNIALTFGIGYALPLFGLWLMKAVGKSSALSIVQQFERVFIVLAGLLVVMLIVSWFSSNAKAPLGVLTKFVLGAIGAVAVAAILYGPLVFPVCLLLGAFAPVLMIKRWDKARAARMLSMGNEFSGEGAGLQTTTHVTARKEQAENCLADRSPTFYLGRSLGELYDRGDVFAADIGVPMLMSVTDLSTHMVVFGQTGSRKTVGALNRIQTQWMAMGCGGMIYIDPKSDGAMKFAHLPNYTVIRPSVVDRLNDQNVIEQGVNINLIEGIPPGKVADILADIGGAVSGSQGGGDNAQFFINNAKTLAFNAEHLLYWAIESQRHLKAIGKESVDEPMHWAWNLADLRRMVNFIAEYDPSDRQNSLLTPVIEFIADNAPCAGRNKSLNAALDYVRVELASQASKDSNSWKSIVSQCTQWFAPLMNDEDLLAWATCTTSDVDIGRALYGQCFGIYLPLRYGKAGELAMALLRRRISIMMRARKEDWRTSDPNATPVLVVIDEAQELLNRQDGEILSMGRSLGQYMLLATQSEAALRAKLNEVTTDTVLNNLLSFIAFRVDQQTFEVIQEKVGKCWKRNKKSHGAAIDFEQNARAMAKSPVFDREHPGAGGYWDHLGAQGAGIPVPARVEYRSHNSMQSLAGTFDQSMDHFASHHLNPQLIVGQGQEEKFILDAADFNLLSRDDGNALVFINRGNKPRRDIVKMTPFPIPSLTEFNAMRDYFATTGMFPEEAKSMVGNGDHHHDTSTGSTP
ncbi:TraM recognition domain-containing protein [Pseudoxanthomonas mexicana]